MCRFAPLLTLLLLTSFGCQAISPPKGATTLGVSLNKELETNKTNVAMKLEMKL